MEWASFAGARYGTPRAGVDKAPVQARMFFFRVDIIGAAQVKRHSAEAFDLLATTQWDRLVARLEGRGSIPLKDAQRLKLAQSELAAAEGFDLVLVNDEVENVVTRLYP